MKLQARLPDPAATDALGQRLAATLPGPAVVYLRGDLGAGKSSLARALLRSLGASGPIRSPTYTLVERHRLHGGEAAHLDLYRIAQAGELDFLGLQELLPEQVLVLVEWPDRGAGALPAADLDITLELEGEGRVVELAAGSALGEAWLDGLRAGPTAFNVLS
jgi:tRNA threonylcarbamoyl adenosine modification protein YjeE